MVAGNPESAVAEAAGNLEPEAAAAAELVALDRLPLGNLELRLVFLQGVDLVQAPSTDSENLPAADPSRPKYLH